MTRQKTRRRLNIALVLLILLFAVIGSVLVAKHKNKSTPPSATSPLVYFDAAKGLASLADSSGKIKATAKLTPQSYVNYEAASPDGSALLSLNSPQSSYVMLGASKPLPAEVAQDLQAADYQGGSHHIVFVDSHTVAFIVCDAGSCKLKTVDLTTGKIRSVLDTGLTPQPFTTYCYLLGVSPASKQVYLRVKGKNKLDKNTNAVYKIDLAAGKILKVVSLGQTAGHSLALSPDARSLVYQSFGAAANISAQTSLNLVDVATGKTTTVKWSRFGITDQAGSLQWSPDSTKVLFRTGTIRFPAGSPNKPTPIYLAYLDTAKHQMVDLQTFSQTNRIDILSEVWLDNNIVAYDQQTASKAGDFSSAKNQILKQDIKTRAVSPFKGPQTKLLQPNY